MNELLQQGVIFFRSGRYFEAHEAWEDLWRITPQGEARVFYQGLIQGAVGLHHLKRGNLRGARLQLEKALGKLAGPPPAECEFSDTEIIAEMRKALETIELGSLRTAGLQ